MLGTLDEYLARRPVDEELVEQFKRAMLEELRAYHSLWTEDRADPTVE